MGRSLVPVKRKLPSEFALVSYCLPALSLSRTYAFGTPSPAWLTTLPEIDRTVCGACVVGGGGGAATIVTFVEASASCRITP